ncbi:exported hypothetical protein [Gammaproteobacteria bacterium]
MKSMIVAVSFLLLSLIVVPGISHAVGTPGALNDTGQTSCYDGSAMVVCALANTGDESSYPRQDGRYGRDAAADIGQLTKIGAGDAGFDFTKIANNGSELAASAQLGTGPTDWACTRDNVTGLLWAMKVYTQKTWDEVQALPAAINTVGLCGFNDWRVPSARELHSITHAGTSSPAIDGAYFPNTLLNEYWTGNEVVTAAENAMFVNFDNGSINQFWKGYARAARLVRGEFLNNFTDNGDGTVTQNNTGLIWAKCNQGQIYSGGSCIGNVTTMKWNEALAAAKNSTLASHDDWRLPNKQELASLVDTNRSYPAMDSSIFPNTPSKEYWTSTVYTSSITRVWIVNFDLGRVYDTDNLDQAAVRLVRGGQCDRFGGSCNGASVITLSVHNAGTGTGKVTSSPAGIDCGDGINDCSETYSSSTSVTLTAAAKTGSTFAGWSGGCSGTTNPCVVTVNAATSVTATFNSNATTYQLKVTPAGTGTGTVTSNPAGINCVDGVNDCSKNYAASTNVTLTAAANKGSAFVGWSGDCSGTMNICTVTMNAAKTVTATFTRKYSLIVIKEGTSNSSNGTVMSSPSGINCGPDCNEDYLSGTSVTLTATVNMGSTFAGWSGGGCSGTTNTCTVTMNAATTVKATFNSNATTYPLEVKKAGTGTGRVISSPAGITCGDDCSENYTPGTSVTLTATAETGSTFASWSGGCSGTTNTCTVTMNATKTVTATFTSNATTYLLTVTPAGTGTGTVTSNPAGINCGNSVNDCSKNYAASTSVTLTAAANTGSIFASWSGGCSGTTNTCTVTMNATKTVTATFTSNATTYQLEIKKAGTGAGTVMSSPAGINCGGDCSENYPQGTVVMLMAMPTASSGSVFTGWSGGGCSGADFCTVTMNVARQVTATFAIPIPAVPVMASAVAGNARVTLKWMAVAGATSYKVYQGFTAGGESTTPLKTGLTGTSVILTGLTNGTQYFFKLAAVNSGGTGPLSNEVSATPVASPVAPIIHAVAGNGQVTLKWSAVAGATSYRVYQGTKAGGESLTPVRSGVTGTSVTLLYLTNGTKYFFKMKAANAGGTSALSNEVSATPVQPPAAPVMAAAVAGNARVTLKWSAVAGAKSYQLYRGTTTDGESTTPIKTGLTGTSLVLTGLTNGTTYFFKMAAVNAGGIGPLSNEVSATPIVAQPDFVITSLTLNPVSPTANSTFTVTISVKNQGTARGMSGYLDVWADQPTVRGCAAMGNAFVDIGILEAGASKNLTVPLTAGSAGSKTLRAFADSWCEIAESNDGNNQLTQVYTVVP